MKKELPSVEFIINNYIEAIGGKALDKINNSIIEFDLKLLVNNMDTKRMNYKERPDKALYIADYGTFGNVKYGSNGNWNF